MDKKKVVVVMSYEVEVNNPDDKDELITAVKKQVENYGFCSSTIDGVRIYGIDY